MKLAKTITALVAGLLAAAVVGTALGSAPAAAVAPKSVAYSVQKKISTASTVTMSGKCTTGYHMRGSWLENTELLGFETFEPKVTVHGDWISRISDTTVATDGTGDWQNAFPEGHVFYGGWKAKIRNWSLASSHTATVSWICEQNAT